MRKFFVLLKKELRDILTLQIIIPLLVGMLIFVFLGQLMGDAVEDSTDMGKLVVVDNDTSSTSTQIINTLNATGIDVTVKRQDIDNAIEDAKTLGISSVIEIPKGFEEGILEGRQQKLKTYTIVKNFSIFGNLNEATISSVIAQINEIVSNKMINEKIEDANPHVIKNPILKDDNVVINGKKANVNLGQIMGFIMSQSVFIPVVIFMIIIYASQMMITAIAQEKENKTLETLLSTPVSRTAVIGAKMVAAGIVSLIFAGMYIFGFGYYMNSLTGGQANKVDQVLNLAIEQLGLSLSVGDYILLGVSLFLSILIALAISTILGGFADDVKKGQALIQPIIFMVLIPYMIVLFVDMNTAPFIIKALLTIIPFSHSFNATTLLFLNQHLPVVLGILYQLFVFVVLITIATRIFSSDKILTMKLRKRRKVRKLKT